MKRSIEVKITALFVMLLMVIAGLFGCTQQSANVQSPEPTAAVSQTSPATQETVEAAASQSPSATPEEEGPPTPAQSCQPADPVSQAPSGSVEEIIATGVYQGQADNNFIEIKIDGQSEDTAYMVFMLTGTIKDNFEDLGLNTGDGVQLTYYKNEAGQLVLTQLSLLSYG
jgi:hypothetical protein